MTYALNYKLLILVCVCLWDFYQAHFSDTEEDCSSRVPVSRQPSSDVKQVRHASQRSKVKGPSREEVERAAVHNATDHVVCHVSQSTVSVESYFVSTYCYTHMLSLKHLVKLMILMETLSEKGCFCLRRESLPAHSLTRVTNDLHMTAK